MPADGRRCRRGPRSGLPALATVLVLAACGDHENPAQVIAPQRWNDLQVQIETRPSPPQAGVDEVLVILAAPRGVITYDNVVSLRTSDADEWIQAIQDGHSGVFRRIVELAPGERSTLQVQVRHESNQAVLRFPLSLAAHR